MAVLGVLLPVAVLLAWTYDWVAWSGGGPRGFNFGPVSTRRGVPDSSPAWAPAALPLDPPSDLAYRALLPRAMGICLLRVAASDGSGQTVLGLGWVGPSTVNIIRYSVMLISHDGTVRSVSSFLPS